MYLWLTVYRWIMLLNFVVNCPEMCLWWRLFYCSTCGKWLCAFVIIVYVCRVCMLSPTRWSYISSIGVTWWFPPCWCHELLSTRHGGYFSHWLSFRWRVSVLVFVLVGYKQQYMCIFILFFSTSAVDCLERFVFVMPSPYCVSNSMLNSTNSTIVFELLLTASNISSLTAALCLCCCMIFDVFLLTEFE